MAALIQKWIKRDPEAALAYAVSLAEVPLTINYQGRILEDGHLVNSNNMPMGLSSRVSCAYNAAFL